MGWLNVWGKIQEGEDLDVVYVAKELWDVDVSSYIKPKSGKSLRRFRRERISHDGTAIFTVEALQKLLLPVLKRECYDRSSGEPVGEPWGIIYYCSPIMHHSYMGTGTFKDWTGPMLKETFYMRYTSKFIYDEKDAA